MADAVQGGFQRYWLRYAQKAKEQRAALPPVAELEAFRVMEALADDPEHFAGRVEAVSATDRVYRHPDPPIEIAYRIDPVGHTIDVASVTLRNMDSALALVAVSYSHKDARWRDELRKFLKPLVRQKRLRIWDDTAIDAGEQWRDEIKHAFGTADVAVLLVSPDFLDSDFIAEQELPMLFEKARRKQGRLLWLAVRPSNYKKQPGIEPMQALNDPEQPLSGLRKSACEKELTRVSDRILAALAPSEEKASAPPR